MNNKYFELYSKRINRMTAVLLSISIIIIFGYIKIQLFAQPNLKNIILKHGYKEKTILGNRGRIIDVNGKELVVTINRYTFWINTEEKYNKNLIVDLFSSTFNKSVDFYLSKLSETSKYVVLEKNVSDEKAENILIGMEDITGIRFDKSPSRLYKYNNLASQTLGYINTEKVGLLGIEQSCNHLLIGDTINITLKKGANGNFYNTRILEDDKINGSDIHLTIDIEFQRILQEELLNMVNLTDSKGANGLIINPHNGEIIAMASIPDFNPNFYNEFDITSFKNSVISDSYEPGSTLKIVPYALALESGNYSSKDSIFCENGSYRLSNKLMLNDHEKHGFLSLEEILIHSSNIGISKVSESFNRESMYKFLKKFGFGNKTYLPLGNEAQGKVRRTSNWSKTSKNYISIGQEISVTNLQLALAYCSIANGGYIIKPTIIKNVIKNNNVSFTSKKNKIRRVLNENTAQNILNTLKLVVSDGTAQAINLIGYNIAGKTGTAQKSINGEYSEFISTFASIFPSDNPQFVMIISIDEPVYGKHWANLSAIPASREIIKRMLIMDKQFHLNTSNKLYTDTNVESENKSMSKQINVVEVFPDFRGKTLRESLKIAEAIGIRLNPKGISGTVLNQSITPGTKLKPDMICNIKMKI